MSETYRLKRGTNDHLAYSADGHLVNECTSCVLPDDSNNYAIWIHEAQYDCLGGTGWSVTGCGWNYCVCNIDTWSDCGGYHNVGEPPDYRYADLGKWYPYAYDPAGFVLYVAYTLVVPHVIAPGVPSGPCSPPGAPSSPGDDCP